MKKALIVAICLLLALSVCMVAVACDGTIDAGDSPTQTDSEVKPENGTGDHRQPSNTPTEKGDQPSGNGDASQGGNTPSGGDGQNNQGSGTQTDPSPAHTHTWGEWTVTKTPTCTESGTRERTCTGCEEVEREVLDKVAHTEVVDAAVAPTCTESGLTEGKHCAVCGEIIVAQETLPALGHTEAIDAAVAPTCTETGLTEGKHCSVCGVILLAQETVPATGHTTSEAVRENEVPATCTEAGYYDSVVYCAVCGEEISRITIDIPALGHTEVIDAAVPVTCTEPGNTEGKHCSVCNEVLVAQQEIPATGHTEVIDAAVPATCSESGLTEGKHCAVCNEVLVAQQEIPATGHMASEAVRENEVSVTCTEAGAYDSVVYCAVCGEELSRITIDIPALGHTEVVDAAVALTCTETGLTEGKHCSVCNEVLVAQQEIPATGHTASEAVSENVVAATCTEAGYYDSVVYCAICGEELSRSTIDIPALGHTEAIDAAVPATCTESGLTEGKHCSVCGVILLAQETVPATGHNYVDGTCTRCGYDPTAYTEGLQLTLNGDEYSVTGYTGSATDVVIPAIYEGKPVTSIGRSAFYECSGLTTVYYGGTASDWGAITIAPDNSPLTSATRYYYSETQPTAEGNWWHWVAGVPTAWAAYDPTAYTVGLQFALNGDAYSVTEYMGSATEVVIPASYEGKPVTSIGNNAFDGQSFLTSISIPASVTYIGIRAFRYCSGLTSISISEGVTSIRYGAFSDCSGLTSISIPEGVTSIGGYAFSGCSGLTSITIPEGVTYIGDYAFYNCSGLTSISIPEGVTSIGFEAFRYCSGLTSITGNATVAPSIANQCGSNAYSVIITTGTSIVSSAFSSCSGLTSITFAESSQLTSIGSYAFYNCSGLTSITIPEGVTYIGDYAFYNCSGLTSISIPEGVTSIGDDAFWNCSGLTSVTFAEGSQLTSIGYEAFSHCSRLTDIHYQGTKAQWNAIKKGGSWNFDTGKYTVHCTDGDISK